MQSTAPRSGACDGAGPLPPPARSCGCKQSRANRKHNDRGKIPQSRDCPASIATANKAARHFPEIPRRRAKILCFAFGQARLRPRRTIENQARPQFPTPDRIQIPPKAIIPWAMSQIAPHDIAALEQDVRGHLRDNGKVAAEPASSDLTLARFPCRKPAEESGDNTAWLKSQFARLLPQHGIPAAPAPTIPTASPSVAPYPLP